MYLEATHYITFHEHMTQNMFQHKYIDLYDLARTIYNRERLNRKLKMVPCIISVLPANNYHTSILSRLIEKNVSSSDDVLFLFLNTDRSKGTGWQMYSCATADPTRQRRRELVSSAFRCRLDLSTAESAVKTA